MALDWEPGTFLGRVKRVKAVFQGIGVDWKAFIGREANWLAWLLGPLGGIFGVALGGKWGFNSLTFKPGWEDFSILLTNQKGANWENLRGGAPKRGNKFWGTICGPQSLR